MEVRLRNFYDENLAIDPIKLGPFSYSSPLETSLLFILLMKSHLIAVWRGKVLKKN